MYNEYYSFFNEPQTREDALNILGLAGNPTEKEITKAYRKAALIYHPDKLINNTEEKEQGVVDKYDFDYVKNAYDILMGKTVNITTDDINKKQYARFFKERMQELNSIRTMLGLNRYTDSLLNKIKNDIISFYSQIDIKLILDNIPEYYRNEIISSYNELMKEIDEKIKENKDRFWDELKYWIIVIIIIFIYGYIKSKLDERYTTNVRRRRR